MDSKNEKLRDACQAALLTLKKINNKELSALTSKLEFCIGSYNHDKNPVGLIECGKEVLKVLKNIKKDNPKKVSKKVTDDLELVLN